jgi:small subunit ribosomal protein S6
VREYELTFIVQPEITDEGLAAICQRLDGILEKHAAERLFYDDLGKRRLAYPIRKFQKGHYLTLFFLDQGKASPELERVLRIDDSVLRFLTVLANPHVEDVAARKAEAVEAERLRAQRAAERAAREAEEAARAAAGADEDEVRGRADEDEDEVVDEEESER